MKANELMVDDWVYNKNIDKPMQVYPMMISQMFRRTPDATTEDYGIFPISLTANILEKNGWRGRSHTQWKFFRDGCNNLNILLSKDYTQVEYLNMIYNPEDNAEVNYGHNLEFPRTIYVHELQHVLRLCGINKTIEL